jgi:formylglycine-generating enzyme required for sulfatase activity
LMDLAGNVWEWTATDEGGIIVLRGGSWLFERDLARVSARLRHLPYDSTSYLGVRLASPVLSS